MADDSISTIWLRFYAELNDCLPVNEQFRIQPLNLELKSGVGEIIARRGIAHSEVDLILVNGESVEWNYQPKDGDRVSVYPVFESFDIASVTKIRTKPLRNCRFVLDVHLGKLAYYLRMLGFDSVYRNDFTDEELVRLSVTEGRMLLTKDRDLLADERIQRGYRVREKHPREQITEVMNRFDLFHSCSPLQRCIRCNVLLEVADEKDVQDQILPRIAVEFHEFQRCPACERVYWKGSHYEGMMAFVHNVLSFRDTTVNAT